MNKTDKIYVAGHRGVVGSAVLDRLVSAGYTNLIVKTHGELDLINQCAVNEFFQKEKPKYVFYCAGYLLGDSMNVVYNNIMMNANTIKAAADVGVSKFLYVGSGSVYGEHLTSPFSEEHSIETIQQELKGGSLEAYAVAKISGLELSKQFNGYNDCKFISALPTHIYSIETIKKNKDDLIGCIIKRLSEAKIKNEESIKLDIWGTGKKYIRQYIYGDDVADALIYLMENYEGSIPINVATDDMVKKIKSTLDYKGDVLYHSDKPERSSPRLLSTERIKALGWKPKFTLSEGIKKLCEHYVELS